MKALSLYVNSPGWEIFSASLSDTYLVSSTAAAAAAAAASQLS